VFRASPTDLRARRRRADRLVADGGLTLRLPVPAGYDWTATRGILAERAVPGVAAVAGDSYRRTIVVGDAPGLLEVAPGDGHLVVRAHLPYWEGLIHLVDRLAQLVGAGPLPTPPGVWSAFEAAVAEAAPDWVAAIVTGLGAPVPGLPPGLTHTFPRPEVVSAAALRGLGLPPALADAVGKLAREPAG
jgi:AraC family transcriptional regulator of adaptative response / DNA-3-methyladenine glycosylase II